MRNTTRLATKRFLSMKGEARAATLATRNGNGIPKVNESSGRVKLWEEGHGASDAKIR